MTALIKSGKLNMKKALKKYMNLKKSLRILKIIWRLWESIFLIGRH